MNKPHKYADVIKAWADGKDIQYSSEPLGKIEWKDWKDYMYRNPFFPDEQELWRIKPEVLRYRLALMIKYDHPEEVKTLRMVTTDEQEMFIGESKSYGKFVKWITDWIEVEV